MPTTPFRFQWFFCHNAEEQTLRSDEECTGVALCEGSVPVEKVFRRHYQSTTTKITHAHDLANPCTLLCSQSDKG
jgi:hypothetical protein